MKRPAFNSGVVKRLWGAVALTLAVQATAQLRPAESRHAARPSASGVLQPASDPTPTATRPRLSPWAKEILKLTQAGVSRNVVEAFIDNAGVFALGADQIIYLTDLGVGGDIIERMLQHDRDLISGVMPPTIVSEPPYEPLVFTIPKAENNSSGAGVAAPAATSPAVTPTGGTSTTATAKTAASVATTSDTRSGTTVVEPEPGAPTGAVTTPRSTPVPQKRDSRYPVREPQPVELLPPILFINAYEPQPNTLVIVGFPRS